MSSKTRIVVLHSKEVIYTAIFAILFILFIVLLICMFSPKNKTEKKASSNTAELSASIYIPGVYTSSITLNNSVIDIEVAVDETNINSIAIVNLDEAVAAMYPLIQPSFDEITAQVYKNQTMDGVSYSDDNKYTSLVLIEAINDALAKAKSPAP